MSPPCKSCEEAFLFIAVSSLRYIYILFSDYQKHRLHSFLKVMTEDDIEQIFKLLEGEEADVAQIFKLLEGEEQFKLAENTLRFVYGTADTPYSEDPEQQVRYLLGQYPGLYSNLVIRVGKKYGLTSKYIKGIVEDCLQEGGSTKSSGAWSEYCMRQATAFCS